ncbi:hypothetical protein DNAM_90 [Pseudomonas phage BroderSalsa]|nr:hypothetical protein DNAM_90 [Pseudomonas phage BroderSalsa]
MSAIIHSNYAFTEDTMVRKDVQEVGSVVDDNKRARLSGDHDQRGKDGRKFAAVPMLVLEKLKAEKGIDWQLVGKCPDATGAFLTWLQENPAWRTSEAKLANGNRYVR